MSDRLTEVHQVLSKVSRKSSVIAALNILTLLFVVTGFLPLGMKHEVTNAKY